MTITFLPTLPSHWLFIQCFIVRSCFFFIYPPLICIFEKLSVWELHSGHALPNIHLIYELLEHVKGLGLQIQSCRSSMTQDNAYFSIFEKLSVWELWGWDFVSIKNEQTKTNQVNSKKFSLAGRCHAPCSSLEIMASQWWNHVEEPQGKNTMLHNAPLLIHHPHLP